MKHLVIGAFAAAAVLIAFPTLAFAAKPDTASALSLPYQNRVSVLERQGPEGLRSLVSTMFDEKAPVELRWRAVISVGKIGKTYMSPELERAAQSKDWFMRNAALIALEDANPTLARKWARSLLRDKALVVRSAAVDTLVHLHDVTSTDLLWTQLESKQNFRGTQSLWIRHQIVDALSALPVKGDTSKFVALLDDGDEKTQAAAIHALESRTGTTLGKAQEPVKFRKAYWVKWWREHASEATL